MKELLDIHCEKYQLKNNLEIILYQDNSIPLISINIWYRVGSAYERKGKSGLAHLFEHMMFQGSMNVPKGMHFKYIQEAGGILNGSTSFDKTNYYEKLPSNYLEMALWLESDRMGFFLPNLDQEKLQNQIDVVKNERLERYDNQPYGLAWEKILSLVFPENHPYHSPTIGWMDDILNYKLEDVVDFFKKYYQPQNASLVVAGDFKISEAKEHISKYFEEIPNNDKSNSIEPKKHELKQNIISSYKDNVQLERAYFIWITDKIYSSDDAALEILADILTGTKNGKLYKNLVFDNQLCLNISAFQFSGLFGGFFCITATAKENISMDKIKKEIFSEIEKILKNGITNDELLRTKNTIKSNFIYSLQNLEHVADQINHYNFYLGNPNYFSQDLSRYINIETQHVSDAMKKYLTKNYVELRIQPKMNSEKVV